MGVAVGDFNNDGFPDLYVISLCRNALYRNNGDAAYSDVTGQAGRACSGWSTGACFMDHDRDGRQDLIVAQHRSRYRAYCQPDQFKPTTQVVYHNNGDGTFTDKSKESGLGVAPSKGFSIGINDFDRDGGPAIAIANDSSPEQLFRNNRDGTFSKVATEMVLGYDEDGKTFAVTTLHSGWGAKFIDYDNDGWNGDGSRVATLNYD